MKIYLYEMKRGEKMKRDVRIDALRTLAIILIVIAHIPPPNWLMQLRVFDVPLMALLLGMSFVLSEELKKKKEPYKLYLIKRFKRLIIPSWVFITTYLLAEYLLALITGLKNPHGLRTVLSSYTLFSGFGYVWIIRIFFTIAIISPLLYWISQHIQNTLRRIAFLWVLLIIQQFLCLFGNYLTGPINTLFEKLIPLSFGYIIIALVGMWAVKQTKKQNITFACSTLVPFTAIGILTKFPLINEQKYPPTIYFITYGLTISLILLVLISNRASESFISRRNEFTWISKHSLEIYYWHTFPVLVINKIIPDLNWGLKFIIIVLITTSLIILQLKFIPGFFNFKFKISKSKDQ